MTDETIIPTPDAPEAENEVVTPTETEVAETSEEVVEAPSTSEETSEVADETPESTDEVASEEAPEEPVAAPVRSTPLTALSARTERPSRAQPTGERTGGDRG